MVVSACAVYPYQRSAISKPALDPPAITVRLRCLETSCAYPYPLFLHKRLEDIENKGMGGAKESKETKRDTQESGEQASAAYGEENWQRGQ
jgi:hypothetical protein